MFLRSAGAVRLTAFILSCVTVVCGVSVPPVAAAISTSQNTHLALAQGCILNQNYENGIPMTAQPENTWPDIVSQAGVVMDLSTGTVLYAKNPLETHFPASITKIMTAIISLQHGALTDELSASENAVGQPSDKVYMVPGEMHTLQELLYALLLDSANDAAVEIAENYGGSVAGFSSMMNQEAIQLGAAHTHFENPNGLPDSKHVTTAYDMALITRAAMQIPEFRQIVQTKMFHWDGLVWHSDLWNLNRMLFYYPGAIGVKTGFTTAARETLVFAATRQSQTFLVVLMDAPTDFEIRNDASHLLDYAFSHYKTETIYPSGMSAGTMTDPLGNRIDLMTTNPVLATVDRAASLNFASQLKVNAPDAEERQGSIVGQMVYFIDGAPEVSVPVQISAAWHVQRVSRNRGSKWVVSESAAGLLGMGGLALAWRRARRQKAQQVNGKADYL